MDLGFLSTWEFVQSGLAIIGVVVAIWIAFHRHAVTPISIDKCKAERQEDGTISLQSDIFFSPSGLQTKVREATISFTILKCFKLERESIDLLRSIKGLDKTLQGPVNVPVQLKILGHPESLLLRINMRFLLYDGSKRNLIQWLKVGLRAEISQGSNGDPGT